MRTMKQKLEDYFYNKKRISLLFEQIEDAKNEQAVMGAYQTSNNETYYLQEKVMVEPVANYDYIAALQQEQRSLRRECSDVERFVMSVTDPVMRQILTIGYLRTAQNWESVADHFEREVSGRAYREKAKRYLEKYSIACGLC